jgi:hypothetical protein
MRHANVILTSRIVALSTRQPDNLDTLIQQMQMPSGCGHNERRGTRMNAREREVQAAVQSHGEQGVVVHDYTDPDEAIRAVQALRGVGFTREEIDVVTRDEALRERIEDGTHLEEDEGIIAEALGAISSLFGRLRGHGVPEEGAKGYEDRVAAGHILVAVRAGNRASLAHQAMHEGLVYEGGMHAASEGHPYLDSSVGSGAGVATSEGTGTGITPGSGYDGNTGSSTQTTTGVLGQMAPGADTPDFEDDFPGDVEHDPRR